VTVRTDVRISTLYLALFSGGVTTTWMDACGRLLALLQSLRAFISVLPRLWATPFPYLSLMNIVTFFISSNNQTPQLSHHHHHHPSLTSIIQNIIIPCTPTHHELSLAVVCSQCCFITFSSFRRSFTSLAFWEPYFLYALASSNLNTRTTHTFFRNFTHVHTFSPPAYLNDRNKQNGFRSRTAAPRLGP
jgi:hypothetical protein